MWQKYLFIILIFYLFALLQNSFFSYYSLLGAVPNLVFIFFFLLVFFSAHGWENFVYAITAGIFLDLLSYTYIGPSIVLLIVIGFLLKKTQLLLVNKGDNYPFVYFAPLFVIFFAVYQVLLMVYLRFFDASHALIAVDLRFVVGIIYSLIIASLGFLIFKKYGKKI